MKYCFLVLVIFIDVSKHCEEARKIVVSSCWFRFVLNCQIYDIIFLGTSFLWLVIIVKFHFRTPLHWAAKRGHKAIVNLLLAHGADTTAVTTKGETPAALCTNAEVRKLFGLEPGGTTGSPESSSDVSLTPYYLKHLPLNARVDLGASTCIRKNTDIPHTSSTTVTSHGVQAGHQAEGSTQNDGK